MSAQAGSRPAGAAAAPPRRRLVLALLLLGLLAGVLARCYRIDAPLYEYRHYRPMDTAALARNFHEGRRNVLYPQVDWRGTSSGYAEAEFQAYAFAVAGLYGLFGEHLWVGRALNIAIYVATALLLFALVRRVFDELAALAAAAAYSVVPLGFFFTRTYQADALIALGVLAGVWFLWVWTDDPRRWWALLLSAAGVSLATLIKPPSLYVGLPLCWLCWRRFGWRFLARPVLWLYAALCIVPAVLWYRWALSLWEVHGNTFGVLGKHTVLEFWGPFDPQWLELGRRLVERVAYKQATVPGIVLLVAGLVLAVRRRMGTLLAFWGAAFVVYLLAVPRGNFGHDYYQLHLLFLVTPLMGLAAAALWRGEIGDVRALAALALGALVANGWMLHQLLSPYRHPLYLPQAALFAAATLALGWTWTRRRAWVGRAVLAVLVAGGLIGATWQLRLMMRPRDYLFEREAFARRVQALTDPGALVVFVIRREWEPPSPEDYRHRTEQGEMLYSDPRDFFLSRRKGFSLDDVQATPEFVEELRRRGARYLATAEAHGPLNPSGQDGVFDRHPELERALAERYVPLEVTERYAIYELVDRTEGR